MKQVVDFTLYFFLGIDEKKKARKQKLKCRAVSETNAVVPGEGYDIFPHIDFVFER
jgi:hypothetical protein